VLLAGQGLSAVPPAAAAPALPAAPLPAAGLAVPALALVGAAMVWPAVPAALLALEVVPLLLAAGVPADADGSAFCELADLPALVLTVCPGRPASAARSGARVAAGAEELAAFTLSPDLLLQAA
jgi:hypothetical protein